MVGVHAKLSKKFVLQYLSANLHLLLECHVSQSESEEDTTTHISKVRVQVNCTENFSPLLCFSTFQKRTVTTLSLITSEEESSEVDKVNIQLLSTP